MPESVDPEEDRDQGEEEEDDDDDMEEGENPHIMPHPHPGRIPGRLPPRPNFGLPPPGRGLPFPPLQPVSLLKYTEFYWNVYCSFTDFSN